MRGQTNVGGVSLTRVVFVDAVVVKTKKLNDNRVAESWHLPGSVAAIGFAASL